MATRRANLLPLAALAALAASCGGDLDPAWKVKSFRILAATIENLDRVATPAFTDAAPGERVRLRLVTADDRDPPRDAQIAWIFCAQVGRVGNTYGCAQGASFQMGREVEYRVPTGTAFSIDTQSRARVQAIAVACAGTLGVDPTTMTPSCTGDGATSWTMTRSILVRLPTDTAPSNRNPAIREVALVRDATTSTPIDPATPLRLPRCTTEMCINYSIELRPADGARESYTALNASAQPVTTTERFVWGFFTTLGTFDGTFRLDSNERPIPIRNTLEAPRAAGTARLWFTAQDPRGGVTVETRTIVFE